MTPFSAPGTGAAPPRPQGPPAAAGVPRPMMGSYGNNLAAAVRVAPSQTPRVQAPIARPRMPLAPHAQGAPIAGVPRPMVNPGGAPMSAPSPTPRMQAVPQPARAPGIPPNTRAVGATVPSARPHTPLSQPTQRAPAVANPAAPSLGKRPPTTTGPSPVPAAKRHAPIPRPQQGAAPTGGAPLPTNPAVGVGAPSPSRHAPAGNATPSRPSPSQLPNLSYIGVYRDPSKGWMARAMDLKRRAARSIGPFDDPHLAALAHDRAAIACAGRGIGGGAPLNFETAFYRVETAFLRRWEGDVCDAVEKGEYEKVYARFLRAGYKAALNIEDGDDGSEQIADGVDAHADELIANCVGDAQFFWDDVEDFFLCRAAEIGEEALKGKEDGRADGGKLLRNRFVEMHRNKSLCPDWRHKNRLEKLRMMTLQKQQHDKIQMHQQQQQQIQTQQRQRQIQMQQQQRQQQIQMKPEQQQHIQPHQQQHQVQMQQQRQQQIQQRQQQFQHQMMIQNQRQQHMMMAQQQQQLLDDDATVQVKQEQS
ncbi:hypothetical protein ACQ4PT_037665 [Festuca glaucescens]